ncbi:MAG: HAMP domain-containing histidine kinase [Alphaproteobacteria bacterium]|nr:HAMP domain-containing histidine kinase [Alphaproteobacteria bacterium]MBU1526521.1 HAMP domain-containing histidine kinase [Alphaproteobacteria bacterium]MBU2117121.1 HAMP domain-containing histidine kinase [Alphaproteobacteria bacterium]MBU2350084.1 HAMP domain-containing histidine kinase [Alphaproteobacteria bacterium]MBU2381241.1 HAMP domain-containing histidine kinase [Alphaproteobacteria bacterium]
MKAAAALDRLRARWPIRRPSTRGLAWRLLLLTAAFTLGVEILIVAPGAASFHERWLLDRLQAAELASVGVEALPYSMVEDETAEELLAIGGVQAVVVGEQGVRRLLLQAPNLPRAPELIDLRGRGVVARLSDPWRTLFGHPDRSLRVQARPRYRSGDYIEILAPAEPLKRELAAYLANSLLLSLLLSVLAGGMLYLGLAFLVLRPLQRVTQAIEAFADDPERRAAAPNDRDDEIGQVERELARMQEEVRQSLRSRARLAALGEAVARINHDLRNMLTSAQIASERLSASSDPQVAKAVPRLERALGRAAALTRNVLDYGKSEEPAARPQRMALAPAVTVAAEDAGLGDGVRLTRSIPARFTVNADPDQLNRLLVNLFRNARQAIEGDPTRRAAGRGPGRVRVSAELRDGLALIRIADDGPGIPERIRARLFQPFVSGAGPDGTGLGLSIARELAVGHGGDLRLIETGPAGTVFELALPA